VTPSVEVKGADVAETIDPDDLTGNDDDPVAKPEQGPDKPAAAAPAPAPGPQVKPAAEDLQLKKALELLKDKPAARAA
jgi:hypothetical protein